MRLKSKVCYLFAVAVLSSSAAWAGFQTPGVVTPDGKTVVLARGRVLYVVDSGTLAVRQRIWVGGVAKMMGWGSDGKTLYVIDDASRLLKLAPGEETLTGPVKLDVDSGGSLYPGFSCDKAAYLKGWPKLVMSFHSLAASPSLIKDLPLSDNFKRGQVVFDSEGKTAVLISQSQTFPEEKENAPEKPEKFDTKLAREVYQEKTDGSGCLIQVIDLETWEIKGPFKVPTTFRDDGISKISGDKMTHIRYSNPCFSVDLKNGETTFFMTPVFCNYGAGFFPNADGYIVGSLAKYGFAKNGGEDVSVELPRDQRVPGWPEYFYGFAAAEDGTMFGWTSASRLAKIAPEGKLMALEPVF